MNPPGRTFYVTIGGCVAAMILGAMIGDGDYTIVSIIILGLALCGALYRVFFTGILLEAVVLGFLLFGNIDGEWGFGHLHLSNWVFVGEVGMAACFLIFFIRVAFSKERFIQRDPLSMAICAYMLIGGVRFGVDFFSAWGEWDYEKNVVRDFASVYYAFFYFITANILKHERSRRFLETVFPVSVIVLVPLAIATLIYPDIWLLLTFHEQAPIYTRADLTGSFLGFGGVYFMLSREGRNWWFLRTVVGFLCFILVMTVNSRSPIVGFGLAIVLLFIAGKLRIIRDFIVFGCVGLVALFLVSSLKPAAGDGNLRSLFKDQITSIFDVGAAGDYETDYGIGKAGNNHFRTEWWKAVYGETMENNPIGGLGFGYDLAARFIRTYDYQITPEDFTARSPHSIVVSTFGRMGFIGISSLLLIVFVMTSSALRCAVAVRRNQVDSIELATWCGIIIIFTSSCFTVMLEGPMAAIVFWSLLGMASYRQSLIKTANRDSLVTTSPRSGMAPAKRPLVAANYN